MSNNNEISRWIDLQQLKSIVNLSINNQTLQNNINMMQQTVQYTPNMNSNNIQQNGLNMMNNNNHNDNNIQQIVRNMNNMNNNCDNMQQIVRNMNNMNNNYDNNNNNNMQQIVRNMNNMNNNYDNMNNIINNNNNNNNMMNNNLNVKNTICIIMKQIENQNQDFIFLNEGIKTQFTKWLQSNPKINCVLAFKAIKNNKLFNLISNIAIDHQQTPQIPSIPQTLSFSPSLV